MRSSLAIGAALAMMLFACGESERPREEPRPCTGSDECEGFCTVPSDTRIGTHGLTGTCSGDVDDSCFGVLEQGTAVATVCY